MSTNNDKNGPSILRMHQGAEWVILGIRLLLKGILDGTPNANK